MNLAARIASLALLIPAFPSSAQQYHTPAEILRILTESKVVYNIGTLKSALSGEGNQNLPLNQHGVYIHKNEQDQYELKSYELTSKTKAFVLKGESFFQAGNVEAARNEYLRAREIMPNNSQLMTFVGQTLGIEQDYDDAIEWYKKAIKTNYIDYLGHWFLAELIWIS